MKPPIYRNVPQPLGSKVCTACAAAIATGKSLAEVEAGMTPTHLPDGSYYYRTREMLKFLGSNGILCGMYFTVGGNATEKLKLTMDPLPIISITAIMVVKSTVFKHADHMVVWDGSVVHDPCLSEPQEIDNYHIVEIYPLIYLDETDWSEEDMGKLIEKNAA